MERAPSHPARSRRRHSGCRRPAARSHGCCRRREGGYRQEEHAGSGNLVAGYGTSGHSGTGRRRPPIRPAASAATPSSPTRAGSSSPEELTGSTFTLNNYGSLGVDGSAAIINHPEVAILGVGRMLERPWVVAGEIVPRRIVQLSLVFDHRVCDGGYAAGFLRTIVDAIEHPAQLYSRL